MWNVSIHSCLISAHEEVGICSVYVAFEGHICCWYIYSYSMINKVAVHGFVSHICAIMCSLHIDYITSAVGYTFVMWQEYMFGGICQ